MGLLWEVMAGQSGSGGEQYGAADIPLGPGDGDQPVTRNPPGYISMEYGTSK